MSEENYEGQYSVTKEFGLLACHNGQNDSAFPEEIQGNITCSEYEFPSFVKPFVKFLWVIFSFQMLLTVFWTRFFWLYPKIRRSIFKFADQNKGGSKSAISGARDWIQRNICCMLPRRFIGLPTTILKQATGVPQVDGDLNNRYAFYRDFLAEKITDEDVRFGHKIFRLPNPAKWKWLYRLDSWLSPKSRIIISFMLILTSILGLLADFFIDIKFLQDLSTETLMDIKFIHINPGAVKAMALYEIPVMLATPLTAYVVYKMAWSHNIQSNLIGEVLIISLGYVLEDGPEMFLQYFYVDKYSGTDYKYPDNFQTSGRLTVLMSSFISFMIALFNILNLLSLYSEMRLYLRFRSIRNYLNPTSSVGKVMVMSGGAMSGDDSSPTQESTVEKFIPIVSELRQIAKEEQMKEKLAYDLYLIESELEKMNKRSRRPTRVSLRQRLKNHQINYEKEIKEHGNSARKANKEELSKLINEENNQIKNLVISVFVLIGVLPFLANLMRLASSCYQIFKYRKYRDNCLKYNLRQNISDPTQWIATVNQPEIFDFACWRNTDYVLIFGNFFALFAHFILLITIGIIYIIPQSPLKEFISEDSDTESEDSEEENSEYSEMRRKAIKRRKSLRKHSTGRPDRSKSALDGNLKKKYERNILRSKSVTSSTPQSFSNYDKPLPREHEGTLTLFPSPDRCSNQESYPLLRGPK